MEGEGKEDEVQAVYDAWHAYQTHPERTRLTKPRRDLIAARLRLGFVAADLVALVRYAYEGDEAECRWWRGDNPDRRAYTDLENLLRIAKLSGRVDRAYEWADGDDVATGSLVEDYDGPLAALRGGDRG